MMKGNMSGAQTAQNISPQLHDIAEMAASNPEWTFSNLSYRINPDLLHEAYKQTRKDGAVGVDKVTGNPVIRRNSRHFRGSLSL